MAGCCGAGEVSKIISSDFLITPGLKGRLFNLEEKIGAAVNGGDLKNQWPEILAERQQICRDYNQSVNIKVFSASAWRVWGDKKRHRTVGMAVDSVYRRAQNALLVLRRHRGQIEGKNLSHKAIDDIDETFSTPPQIRADREFLHEYLARALDSLEAYAKLVDLGIKERDAIFVVPRGLKLGVVQNYDLYNLIAGYFPLRICSTAEEELRRASLKEAVAIKNLLQAKGLEWLGRHIVPKCHCAGFCLEENCCGMVKNINRGYDDAAHKEMHADLENKFQKIIEKIKL
jgi:hypothetical protein